MSQPRTPLHSIDTTNTRRVSIAHPVKAGQIAKNQHVAQAQQRRLSLMPQSTVKGRRSSALPLTPTVSDTPGLRGRGQNRNSKSSARLSIVPASRNAQDPRNVKEKQFISDSIALLWNFMTKNDFPYPIATEQLKHPSTKDFGLIFEWMFRHIDSKFDLSTKDPGAEIPIIFKTLGYPFAITKSSFLSAGAPHTWPVLLAALSWLRELLEYEEIASASIDPEQPFARPVPHPRFFHYIVKSYSLFLQNGVSRNENLIKELEEEFNGHFEAFREEIEEKKQLKVKITDEQIKLENDNTRPHQLKKDLAVIESDFSKFHRLLIGLGDHNSKLEKKIEREHKTRADLASRISSLDREIAESSTILREQEISQIGVDRINRELNQLNENIQNERIKKKNLENTAWDKEIAVSDLCNRCEREVAEYTRLCTALKLLPENSKNSAGNNFSLSLYQYQLARDPKTDIIQKLNAFVTTQREKEAYAWNCCFEYKNNLESLKDKVRVSQYEIQCMEDEERKLEKLRLDRRNQLDAELSKLREQSSLLRKQKEEEMALQMEQLTRSEVQLQKAKKEHDELEVLLKQKHANTVQRVCSTLELVYKYKKYVNDELNSFKKHLQTQLETAI